MTSTTTQRCSKFYGRQEFLQDSCGKDENCRWCADGGDLICCDTCSNAFCKRCIKRNLGRGVLQKIESLGDNDTWSCFVCDRTPIVSLQLVCSEALEKVQEWSFARKRRSDRAFCGWKTRLGAHVKVVQPPGKTIPIKPAVPTTVTPQPNKPSERICVPASDAIKTISAVLTHLSQLGANNTINACPSTNASKLAEALRSVTHSLSTTSSGNPSGVISVTPSTITTPLGRPTVLIRDIPATDANGTAAVPPTSAVPSTTTTGGPSKPPQSFDIGIILSQISHVNTDNIDVAIKATRRCIETFSADLHRLETKLPKANDPSEIARIVRSFQSIYRFHFFARLANLSSRIREEVTQSGASSSTVARTGMSQNKTSPNGTIDLTDDADHSSVHTTLTSNNTTLSSNKDSPAHKSSKQQLKSGNTGCSRLLRSPSPSHKRQRTCVDNSTGLRNSTSQVNTTVQIRHEQSKLSMQSPPSASHPTTLSENVEGSTTRNNSDSTASILGSSSEKDKSENSGENDRIPNLTKDKEVNARKKDAGHDENEENREEDDEDDVEWKLNVLASLARRTDASETGVTEPEESNISTTKTTQSSSGCPEPYLKVTGLCLRETSVVLEDIGASFDGNLRHSTDLDQKSGPTGDSSDLELKTIETQVASIERSLESKDKPDGSPSKAENSGGVSDDNDTNSAKNTARPIATRSKTKKSQSVVHSADAIPDLVGNDKDAETAEHDSDEAAPPDLSLSNSDVDQGDAFDGTPDVKSGSEENSHLATALLDREEDEYARNLTSREHLLHGSSADDDDDGDPGSMETDQQANSQKASKSKKRKRERSTKTAPYHGLPRSLMTPAWSSSDNEEDRSAAAQRTRKSTKDGKVAADQDEQSDGSVSRQKHCRSRSKITYRKLDDNVSTSDNGDDDELPFDGGKSSTEDEAKSHKTLIKNIDQSASEDEDTLEAEKPSGRKPVTRRRSSRRVRTMSDEDKDSDKMEDDSKSQLSDKGDDEDDEFETKLQGRKRIRAILGEGRLSQTTKTAEAHERERRKRLSDRQKLYNDCVLQEGIGLHVVTKKLVLEKPSDNSDVTIEVNEEILKHLKPHQVEAVRFMWDCCIESVERHKSTAKEPRREHQPSGAILAHCMGLGKTLSVIAFVHTLFSYPNVLHMRTCLVICPVNTLLNWKHECEMWLPEDSDIEVFHLACKSDNSLRAAILKRWHSSGGIMLIGYDMFRNLVNNVAKRGRKKSAKEAVTAALLDPGPDLIVCDEGHLLKNTKSGLSKAVSEVGSLMRIMLTGTPLQNRLSEYHAMVNFVKPNLLGTEKEFSNRFANPIKNGQHRNSTEFDVNVMKRRAHVLYKTLEGCVQRKDYSALTKYLPPRHEYVIKCRLTDVQCVLYRRYLQLRNEPLTSTTMTFHPSGVRRTTLFADQQTLYRIWTHPYTLRLHETREARKALLLEEEEEDEEDDAFIADTSSSEASSSRESRSSTLTIRQAGGSDAEVDEERAGATTTATTTKSTRYATRSNSNRLAPEGSDENGDDVVCVDSSSDTQDESTSAPAKKRLKVGGESQLAELGGKTDSTAKDEPWWYEYYKDEYDWRVDAGVKLDVLFRLLKKCQDIGDKMIIFTHSLFSLDLIERFLGELHRQWVVSQGEVPSTTDQTDGNLENRADVSDYFSDIGLNTWIRGLDYERMDGSMNAIVRKDLQRRFNRPQNTRFRLFIISTRAGGLGINLIAANRIIMFDASWNPSHDIQSIFRSYRFGQVKPVYIYRLIAQGTMEEKIYDRQVTKQSLSLRVIDERQIDRHFTFGDLQALFDFDPDEWGGPDTAHQTLKLPKDRLLADMLSEFPWLLCGYHEHDSLLEHREDEGLTEAQRQEAWREYEQEKSSGVSLIQYQRIMAAHQEQVALYQQQQALAQQRLQKNFQQQPQQQSNQPSPLLVATTHLLPPRPSMSAPSMSMLAPPPPRPPVIIPPSPDIAFPQMYSRLRAHLLASHPSLTADPVRVEKLVMNRLLETLMIPIEGPPPHTPRLPILAPSGSTSTSVLPPWVTGVSSRPPVDNPGMASNVRPPT